MKEHIFDNWTFLALFLCMAAITVINVRTLNQIEAKVSSNAIYQAPMQTLGYQYERDVKGVYIPGCGYMVDTRGSNVEQIQNTEYHEACHALVYEDYEHFCEDVSTK